jgi:hypothetical protein
MKGYKTLAFNGVGFLVMLAQVITEFGYSQELQFFATEEVMPYIMLAILAANVVLRILTTTPAGKR